MATFADPVLEYSQSVLVDADYSVVRSEYSDANEMLVAENAYSIIGLVHVEDLEDLIRVEELATTFLIELLGSTPLGAKQWDSYLVFLVSDSLTDDDEASERIFDISYDTQYFRRLVRTGVVLSERAIADALSSFLPLRRPEAHEAVVGDPLTLLRSELLSHGVEESDADHAMAAFRDTGKLTGV